MSFSKVHSAQVHLLRAHKVDIEVDLSRGLNHFSIVGLPDKAVEESKDRVSAAIKNCGFESPKSKNQKVVVSLAPADIRKEGPNFDTAIALAYLLATEDIRFEAKDKVFLGELSLDGNIRPIKGVLPLVLEAKRLGFKEIYIPFGNEKEASIIQGIDIYGASHLKELILHLDIRNKKEKSFSLSKIETQEIIYKRPEHHTDISDIKGQEHAKRALEISASGGHNIMMFGPPGTGKTMLAKAFSNLLPELSFDEILETTSIHSTAGNSRGDLVLFPPFRSPHHSASHVSLIGGGSIPKPGEVTLAHRGVLFMDEFPEFDTKSIEALRQPLEDKIVSVSRIRSSTTYPSDFILVATMNPCPCGNRNSIKKECICSPFQIAKYERKLSGPIVDRIDMWIEVSEIDYEKLGSIQKGEVSDKVRERIKKAREIQRKRFAKQKLSFKTNAQIGPKEIESCITITDEARNCLNTSSKKLNLSARAYHRIIKLAQTIADMEEKEIVGVEHILEALQYRPKNAAPK